MAKGKITRTRTSAATYFLSGKKELSKERPDGVSVFISIHPWQKGKEFGKLLVLASHTEAKLTNYGPRERNMGKQTPSLAAETEALRDAYAALNRNDIPAFVNAFDPQIEWIEPAESPGAGTYHGLAVVKAHLSQARGSWAEGSCEPERFIVAGDKIIVFVHVRVRLKHEIEWREGQTADVYTFRNGKVIQNRVFVDRRQALEWAGLLSFWEERK